MTGRADATAGQERERRALAAPRWLLLALLAVLLAALGLVALDWTGNVRTALAFPYQIDYGEGVVWQQAEMILRGHGYAPLAEEPHIVFHYPPVFHLATGAMALATGDMLVAGRLVTVLSTVGTLVLLGILFRFSTGGPRGAGDGAIRTALTVAVPLLFLANPILPLWSVVMRVDMIAMLFGLAGAVIGLTAPERPRALWGAALCFTFAIYAKQSHIALPAATFGTLLLTSPVLGLRGIAITALLGFGTLGVLMLATGGTFLTHVVLYNANPADLGNLTRIAVIAVANFPLIGLAGFAAATVLWPLGRTLRAGGLGRGGRGLAADRALRTRVLLALFLVATTALLPLALKSGAVANYFIEWICAITVLAGIALMDLAGAGRARGTLVAAGLMVLLSIWVAAVGSPRRFLDDAARTEAALAPLARLIAEAEGPVLSDEMVMVRRTGRDVVWESAIHRELARVGRWDPAPFAERIRAGEFAMVVTEGDPGTVEIRFPPAIAAAIAQGYPVRQQHGDYIAHLPAGSNGGPTE